MADGGKAEAALAAREARAELSTDEVTHMAERAVLAAALLDPRDVAPLLGMLVTESDFGDPVHAEVFRSILNVLASGAPVDVCTLAADLRARERLNTIGGAQYLGELTDDAITTAHVEAHALIVRDGARRRRVLQRTTEVKALCLGGAPMEQVEAALAKVNEAAASMRDEEGLRTLGEAGVEVIDHLERLGKGGGASGVTTGFRVLDRRIGRFRAGQLIVIGARPAMGKSALTEVMAILAAVEELVAATAEGRPARPVIFFSLEMPRLELAARAMAYLKQVDLSRIIHGRLSADELARVYACTQDLARLPFKILAGPVSYRRIRAVCLREKARSGGVLAVYIDYAQIILTEERSEQSRERELAKMTGGLKQLAAKEHLNCPIVVDAQLNRELEKRPNKRPIPADLRESGALEQDADVLLFVYRDVVYNKDTEYPTRAEVIVAKQRNGPPGTEYVGFNGATTTFYDLPYDAVDDDPAAPDAAFADATFAGEGLPDAEYIGPLLTPVSAEGSAGGATPADDEEINADGGFRW